MYMATTLQRPGTGPYMTSDLLCPSHRTLLALHFASSRPRVITTSLHSMCRTKEINATLGKIPASVNKPAGVDTVEFSTYAGKCSSSTSFRSRSNYTRGPLLTSPPLCLRFSVSSSSRSQLCLLLLSLIYVAANNTFFPRA
jgi:hypothetical protein